jgi:hypothetical protein
VIHSHFAISRDTRNSAQGKRARAAAHPLSVTRTFTLHVSGLPLSHAASLCRSRADPWQRSPSHGRRLRMHSNLWYPALSAAGTPHCSRRHIPPPIRRPPVPSCAPHILPAPFVFGAVTKCLKECAFMDLVAARMLVGDEQNGVRREGEER